MMIWAKEIFFTTWPSFKLVDCSINIGSNYVYAVTTDPLQMVMLNGVDGSLMHSKVLYCASSVVYCSVAGNIMASNIIYIPIANNVVLYYRDIGVPWYSYVTLLSSSDLSYITTDSVWDSPNYNPLFMKASVDLQGTVPYIESAAVISQSGIYIAYYLGFVYSTSVGSVVETTQVLGPGLQGIASTHLLYDSVGGGNIRIGCMHNTFNEIQQQSADNFYIFIQHERVTPIIKSFYTWLAPGTIPLQIMCRETHVTNDFRMFVFFDQYAGTGLTWRGQLVLELTVTSGSTFATTYGQQTSMYLSSILGTPYAFYKMFKDPVGADFFYHSSNGVCLTSKSVMTFNSGYLMKEYIQTPTPTTLIAPMYCVGPSYWYSIAGLGAAGAFAWSSPPAAAHIGNLYQFVTQDDTGSNSPFQMQDLPFYQNYNPGCATPVTLPLHLPSVDLPLYYVVGQDTGIKRYPLTQNPSWSLLTSCQQRLLSFGIKMQSGGALPTFLTLQRSTLSMEVNAPTAAQVGTYLISFVLQDIYGNSASLAVTLIVVAALNTPNGINNCYFDPIVLQGSAFDVMYKIGTRKATKLHFEAPVNSLGISCESLIVLEAYELVGSTLNPLPSFMSLDTTNRQVIISTTSSAGASLLGQTTTVKIISWLIDYPTPKTSFTFQVHFTAKDFLGCPDYYSLIAPTIEDMIFAANSPATTVAIDPFLTESASCNSQITIQKTALQTNRQPLPSCISIDLINSKLSMMPSLCLGTLPMSFKIRIEAWLMDSSSGIKTHGNFTSFTVTVLPTNNDCLGSLFLALTNSKTAFDKRYLDIDSPSSVSNIFSTLLVLEASTNYGPATFGNPPSTLTCESSTKNYIPIIFQDQGFKQPSFITQSSSSQLSYTVSSSQVVLSNIGTYDIRLAARYTNSDTVTWFSSLRKATVVLNLEIYQASLCQFSQSPSPPSRYNYQLVRQSPTLMDITFPPFQLTIDGCIYDRLQYIFQSQDGSPLPSFMSQNPSTLTLTIQSQDLKVYGDYALELKASLNPSLVRSFPFTVSVLPYVNTGPPKFRGSIKSPVFVTVGSSLSYKLPSVIDPDGNSVSLELIQPAPSFITLDSKKRTLKIEPKDLSDAGQHIVSLNLTDDHPLNQLSKVYQIVVQVQLLTFTIDASLLNEALRKQHQVYVGAQIGVVSISGQVNIKFNQSIFDNSTGPYQFNNASLTIQVVKAYTKELQDVNWTVTNANFSDLYIQLNFQNPSIISMLNQKDQIQIAIKDKVPLLQREVNDTAVILQMLIEKKPIPPGFQLTSVKKTIVLNAEIPQQSVSSGFTEAVKAAAPYLLGSSNTLMIGNLFLNIILQVQIQLNMQVSVSPDALGNSEHPATDCSRGALQPELPEQLHGPLQCLS